MKTYDLEVWLPGAERVPGDLLVRNCGDFQARRAKIRFRAAEGREAPAAATRSTAPAWPWGARCVAMLENFQREDGTRAPSRSPRAVHGRPDASYGQP